MSMIFDNTALAAFNAQLTAFEIAVFEEEYDDIQYSQLIPVDTSAPEWVKGVTYASVAGVGQAKWINGGAQDIPSADITTGEVTTEIELGAIGYSYTLEEVSQSQLHNFPLDSSRASAAHRAAEEFIDKVALEGDAVHLPRLALVPVGTGVDGDPAVDPQVVVGHVGLHRDGPVADDVVHPGEHLEPRVAHHIADRAGRGSGDRQHRHGICQFGHRILGIGAGVGGTVKFPRAGESKRIDHGLKIGMGVVAAPDVDQDEAEPQKDR